MSSTWFDRAIGVQDVRDAVYDVLGAWLDVALVEQARDRGYDLTPGEFPPTIGRRTVDGQRAIIETPRSFYVLADWRSPEPDQLPNVAVGVAQAQQSARRAPRDPVVDVTWTVNVASIVRGRGYRATAEVGGIYTTAVALVLDHHLRSHPLVDDCQPPADGGEMYDGAADDQARTLAVGVVTRQVTVAAARAVRRLHDQPPSDPFDAAPERPDVVETPFDTEET